MNVTLKLFAAAKDVVGSPEAVVSMPEGASVADLRQQLVSTYPELSQLMTHCRFAIDNDYVGDDAVLRGDADIACIPPVSGG